MTSLAGAGNKGDRHERRDLPIEPAAAPWRIRASDIAARHGTGCECVQIVPLEAVGLAGADLVAVRDLMARRHLRLDLAGAFALLHDKAVARHEASLKPLARALMNLAASPCPTRMDISPGVGWRSYEKPGLSGASDRWPDDWDGVDWYEWAVNGALAASSVAEMQAKARTHDSWGLANLLYREPDDEQARYDALFRPWVAVRTHDRVPDGEWSYDNHVRALAFLRSRRFLPVDTQDADLVALSVRLKRDPVEVLAFLRLVERCDRGVVAASETMRLVLSQYGPTTGGSLRATVDMMDALVVPSDDPNTEHEEGEEELLEASDEPLALEEAPPPPAEDGGPDPLAVVRRLLPGGDGTRGIPPIIFTPTRLDTELVPYLAARQAPTLVVLSGNAGDGKTAFLGGLLKDRYRPGANEYESVWIGDNEYLVVLDGSEDTETKTNDELLLHALAPFAGAGQVAAPSRGTLIAINKGRLLRFLEVNAQSFGYLWRAVTAAFLGWEDPEDSPYLLIDLNDRSVLAPDPEHSLFGGVVAKLVEWSGWTNECAKCLAQASCPVLHNVRLLEAPATRAQLWRVLAAVDLDDRVHVTARHLVTKLTRALVSDHRCPDIRSAVQDGQHAPPDSFLYNSLFVQDNDGLMAEPALMDRVTSTYDPAERTSPRRDRQLAMNIARGSAETILGAPIGAPELYLREELLAAAAGSVEDVPADPAHEYRRQSLALMRHVARRMFFTAPTSELAPAFPIAAMDSFLQTLERSTAGDGDAGPITEYLNAALGVEAGRLDGLLAPRDYSRGLQGRGLALVVPRARFAISTSTGIGIEWVRPPFLEAWARALTLVATDVAGVEVARLTIPLMLYELLTRASTGFRPTTQTERGFMVRLHGFYRALAEHGWGEPMPYVLYDNGVLLGRARLEPSSMYIGVL